MNNKSKIWLSSPHMSGNEMKYIQEASDGNGGTYSSLRRSGCLADMKEKGIKWVFIGSVDNALLKMVDVTLLGMAIDQGVQIASKSVVKANPHERVGVFCKMNGHPKVIEYSELPVVKFCQVPQEMMGWVPFFEDNAAE